MSVEHQTAMVKRAALLVLSTAQRDRATHTAMGPTAEGGTWVRYRINGTWYDWSTIGIPWPEMASELEGLAGIRGAAYPKEGIIYVAYSGVRLRWQLNVAETENGCLLSHLGPEIL